MTRKILIVAGLTAFTAGMASADMIADSVVDFDGNQGTNGWTYGYYDSDDSFQTVDWSQMEEYDGGWRVQSANYWTGVWSELMHPNAGGTEKFTDVQSAARRWTSDMTGTIDISGIIAHHNYGIVAGDGVMARVMLNGVEQYSYDVAADDFDGVNYALSLEVNENDVIDFVVSAGDTAAYDATLFTTTIVPAPASLSLLGVAGLAFRRRR